MAWTKMLSAGHQSIRKRRRGRKRKRKKRLSLGEVGSASCAAWVADSGGDVAAVRNSPLCEVNLSVRVPGCLPSLPFCSVSFIALLIYPIVQVVSGN